MTNLQYRHIIILLIIGFIIGLLFKIYSVQNSKFIKHINYIEQFEHRDFLIAEQK